MRTRTFLGECGCAAVALLILMSGPNSALGQGAAATPASAATSSTEEGRTPLYKTFDFDEWRLEERRQALKDTKFELNLRTMFLDRNKFDGLESEAWAIGGWLGVKTGYFLDHIAFGATYYFSVPIYAPESRDGTLLLEKGQEEYDILGELYADIRIIDGLNLNIGRKAYDTPFINRNDTRMTPNTFEAIVLQGVVELDKSDPGVNADGTALRKEGKNVVAPPPKKEVATLKYGLGYFDQIKERNSDDFVSMARDAGADVERGVFSGGLIYQKGKFSIGAIDYYSDDIINIAYAETKGEIPFSEDWRPRYHIQFADEHSVGDNLLDGDSFRSQELGLKAELPVKNALFTAAFTHTWGDASLRAPWSGHPGYTSVQVQDFNRPGESAFLFRIGYEFPWIDGLSAYALAVFGTTPDQSGQYRQDEYDFNLQCAAPKKSVVNGLSVRLRFAIVDQHGGNVEDLTDFRATVNYLIKF